MTNSDLEQKAIKIAKENPNTFCITLLQQNLKIGYVACNKLMEYLEYQNIISPYDPDKKYRTVLL